MQGFISKWRDKLLFMQMLDRNCRSASGCARGRFVNRPYESMIVETTISHFIFYVQKDPAITAGSFYEQISSEQP